MPVEIKKEILKMVSLILFGILVIGVFFWMNARYERAFERELNLPGPSAAQ